MRMKSKWYKKDKTPSLEESASALGFICWQIAVDRVKNMERWNYYVDLPDRTLNVISEFLIFMAHMTDRLSFDSFEQAERVIFLNALVKRLSEIVQDNREDAKDLSQTQQQFIDLVNQRFSDYSGFEVNNAEPAFGMYRYLGDNIFRLMGEEHNKGVTEQIIEVEGPESLFYLKRALNNLLGI
ncbi:MAG: hypothetical protein R3240_00345 [Gammaproteobacteria bacterium]|nr:hypothetical protein [Gammaproteobacteria bacterium]